VRLYLCGVRGKPGRTDDELDTRAARVAARPAEVIAAAEGGTIAAQGGVIEL
jgi:hypothetical protein